MDETGHGLGMAICYAAATLHRGAIVVDRQDVGVCIRVLLPCRSEDGFSDKQLLALAQLMSVI